VIDNGDMLLNDAGRMIDETWSQIPEYLPDVELDVTQVMPNYLHGIFVVREVGTAPQGCVTINSKGILNVEYRTLNNE